MAQKSKNSRSSAQRSKLSKKSKGFRPARNKYWTGVFFIVLFAALGAYLIIRSFAAPSFLLLSSDFDAANSVNAHVISEAGNSSKKNNNVVELTPGASSKATFTSTYSESNAGVYKVCMNALVVSGTASGNFSVTPYLNSPTGQGLTVSYSLAAASDYSHNICIKGVIFTLANMGAQAVITNTGSGTVHIGSIILTKTADIPPPPPEGFYLSPSGSDSNPGTINQPWRTFSSALPKLRPGDILYARGGTYKEIAKVTNTTPGSSSARITVQNYPGERPVIQGMFWLAYPSFWTINGINVTWDSGNPNQHMVQLYGGTDWVLENSELWGAHSYADLLIGTGQKNNLGNFTIQNNCIHDTYATNPFPQDHNMYVDNSSPGTHGVIEHNIFYNAPNGRGIKLGPGSSSGGPQNITVRYNTIYNSGEYNVSVSRDTANNQIYGNILDTATASYGANVGSFDLSGANNVASNNIGYNAKNLLGAGIVDGGGNIRINPQFDSISCTGFHPGNSSATNYGKYRP